MLDGPVVAGAVLAGGAVLVGAYFYVDHLRHGRTSGRSAHVHERLPLFGVDAVGPDGTGELAQRAPTRMPRPERTAAPRPAPVEFVSPLATVRAPTPAVAAPAQAFAPPAYSEAYASVAAERTNGTSRQPSAFPMPRYADGQTVRFAVPDEGTLQFLPGRLQVVVGPESGREIRFVRSPNTPDTDVTFGRSEGPPHRHVQLLVPTVSRRHALMSLLDEHWSLQNLSATNPITHNGRRLAPDEVVPLLVDGDRIEMGEVVFVFHNR